MLTHLHLSILLSPACRKGDILVAKEEEWMYEHVLGMMLYIAQISAPFILLQASMMATRLSNLHNQHLRALTSIVRSVKRQRVALRFLPRRQNITEFPPFLSDIVSDGPTAPAGNTNALGRHLMFRPLWDIVHLIRWSARRLQHMSYSSSAIETFDHAGRLFNAEYVNEVLRGLSPATVTEFMGELKFS